MVERLELSDEVWRVVQQKDHSFLISGGVASVFNAEGYYVGTSPVPLLLSKSTASTRSKGAMVTSSPSKAAAGRISRTDGAV